MRIVYFTESLPPIIDGVTHTLCELVKTLEDRKIEYRFYSPFKPGNQVNWSDRVSQVKSLPFPLYRYYRMGLPYLQGLEEELNAFQPDLVHVVNPTLLGIYGIQYAKKNSIPVVASYHTHFVFYFSYYGFSVLEKWGWNYLQWFYNQTYCTFAPSKSAVRELQRNGIMNVKLWQRGIDLKNFSPHYRCDGLRRQVGAIELPILLYVGRLVKEKDLEILVKANHLLEEKGYTFKLVFVGDGPMRAQLQQQLPNAFFSGYLQGIELARWYASADLFVFPSTTETFGNVVLEAFASGLTVVAVDQGGVTDLISHGINGLLAKPRSPADFAHNIEILIKNEPYRQQLAKRAIETAHGFDWKVVNNNLIDNYYDILKNRISLCA